MESIGVTHEGKRSRQGADYDHSDDAYDDNDDDHSLQPTSASTSHTLHPIENADLH